MSLTPRPLQGKTQLVEEPLTLPYAERNSVTFLEMVRQEHPVPKVLVVPQFPGRTSYLASQPLLLRGRKPAGSTRPLALLQPSQTSGNKALNPLFHAPGRVTVQTCRLIRAGSMEDLKNHMEPMEVSPFLGPRYFVLDGCDECLCIRNRNPSHWEHLPWPFAPTISEYSIMRNYVWRII